MKENTKLIIRESLLWAFIFIVAIGLIGLFGLAPNLFWEIIAIVGLIGIYFVIDRFGERDNWHMINQELGRINKETLELVSTHMEYNNETIKNHDKIIEHLVDVLSENNILLEAIREEQMKQNNKTNKQ
jgi:hypothetical protein